VDMAEYALKYTALQAAAYGSHEVVICLLLDKGADINAQGELHGSTQGADVNASLGWFGDALECLGTQPGTWGSGVFGCQLQLMCMHLPTNSVQVCQMEPFGLQDQSEGLSLYRY